MMMPNLLRQLDFKLQRFLQYVACAKILLQFYILNLYLFPTSLFLCSIRINLIWQWQLFCSVVLIVFICCVVGSNDFKNDFIFKSTRVFRGANNYCCHSLHSSKSHSISSQIFLSKEQPTKIPFIKGKCTNVYICIQGTSR